jgi:triacylglycerol lipase
MPVRPLSLIGRSLAVRCFASLCLVSACMTAPAAHAQATTTAATDTRTRHPIVLVHGLLGFDDILGVQYFYGIPAALRAGGATVFVAKVSAVNDNDVRGEQLLKQMRDWSSAHGHQKFNLIAHSQGGPTARYVAGVAPQLVASVTSIASPHTLAATGREDVVGQALSRYPEVVRFAGRFIDWLSGSGQLPSDPNALKAWSENTAAFNARFPAGAPNTPCGEGPELAANGVRYYSATGNRPKTNAWDPADLIMTEGTEPSDGLVTVCASRWGQTLRPDLPWNHFDEINQAFGLIGRDAPDPVAFYRQHANRLKQKGL